MRELRRNYSGNMALKSSPLLQSRVYRLQYACTQNGLGIEPEMPTGTIPKQAHSRIDPEISQSASPRSFIGRLLPIGRDHRSKRGGIVRWQPGLSRRRRRECRHRINQVLHLRIKQGLVAVNRLELLDVIGRAQIPALHRQTVGCADNTDL